MGSRQQLPASLSARTGPYCGWVERPAACLGTREWLRVMGLPWWLPFIFILRSSCPAHDKKQPPGPHPPLQWELLNSNLRTKGRRIQQDGGWHTRAPKHTAPSANHQSRPGLVTSPQAAPCYNNQSRHLPPRSTDAKSHGVNIDTSPARYYDKGIQPQRRPLKVKTGFSWPTFCLFIVSCTLVW